ncbi:LAETG motif-containing sortase-dependent surface protein [Streptomyces montanisoli]|uniref:LAETG motif-containing sortase-dependent surface protein n=1 Tax=Streptomyces montanisoli TaxID=2798581 RepID=UPI0027DB3E22|nr:LAETG motif-containing sortase-dependent surface protein [Streptomyces montanisoli]
MSVNLQAYDGQSTNTVELMVDGKDLVPVTTFGSSFQRQHLDLPDHGAEITAHLVVKAGDNAKYDFDDTKTVKDCPIKSTPPTAPPSSQPPSSQPPSAPASSAPASSAPASSAPASPAPASSSAAAAPVASPSASGDNLAETGSSSSTPVIAGAAAVVVIAGAGILWASRKRRAAQH